MTPRNRLRLILAAALTTLLALALPGAARPETSGTITGTTPSGSSR